MHLKDNFESGAPISQVPASWFNRVAKFINNLVGGENIEIEKHDDGSASVISAPNILAITSRPENPSLVSMNSAGAISPLVEIPTTASTTSDRVLTVKKGETDVSWENRDGSCTSSISETTGISITPDYDDSTSSASGKQAYLNIASWKPPTWMTGDNTAKTPVGWERGKTAWKNGHVVDDTHPAVGCSVKVCSHAILRTVNSKQAVEYFFTNLQFDENGCLVRAIPGCDWYVDYV